MKFQKQGKLLATGIATALTASLATAFFGAPEQNYSASIDRQQAPSAMTFSFGDERPVITAAAETSDSLSSTIAAPAELAKEADGDVIVRSDRATASTSVVRVKAGGDLYPQGKGLAPADKAAAFLERHGSVFGISDMASELRVIDMSQDQYGNSRVTYQQMHGDVPVFGGVMHSHISQDGRLTAVNGKFIADVGLPTTPTINKDFAAHSAITSVSNQLPSMMKGSDLTVASMSVMVYRENLTKGAPGANHLAYQVEVTGGNSVREFVYVDALSGKIVDQITGIHGAKMRRTHEGSIDAPALWKEGDLRPAIQPAHEDEVAGAGESYNLFFNLSGGTYRSWDGADAEMITVNNDPTIVCPNANWNGTSTNYCTGTSADDVVAHEWGHAYTQETSGLIYAWQSGALNESYSDIWGETVDLHNEREFLAGAQSNPTGNTGPRDGSDDNSCSDFASQFPEDDASYRWLMGEDAFLFAALPPVGDAAIRDMWHPQCFGDAGHVNSGNYYCSSDDGGGVHSNSSINNRAYALLVDGDTITHNDDGSLRDVPVTVTGIGFTKAAHIFWRANSVYNTPASNFADNADSLEMACADLIGTNLTKLVTTSEVNAVGIGGRDTVDPTIELSGEIISAADCDQVTNAIEAVQMRFDVTKMCGFKAMLDPAPAPMCGNAETLTFFREDWEAGQGNWTTGQEGVSKTTLDTLPWQLTGSNIPANRDGSAHSGTVMFQENRRDLGNCTTDDESGRLWLESPEITVHPSDPSQLMFEHYVNTEVNYDGGNVMISINDGNYQVIPAGAFVHNAYNSALSSAADQNTNPKAGQAAWTGGNQGEVSGDWGQSQINLAAAGVTPGDRIKLRFDFGQDGCNGNDGWYVDQVEMFTCGGVVNPPDEMCTSYPADVDAINGTIVSILAPSVTYANVSGAGSISDGARVNIRDLDGNHTYMGDLTFELESPAGTSITLFDGAACAGDDWAAAVDFDDTASGVIACGDWAGGGEFQPQQALAAFEGENPNGEWVLTVADSFPQDEGSVSGWAVEICTPIETNNEAPTAVNDTAETDQNESVTIDVLFNDSDPENDPLTVDSVTMPANGMAFIVDNMVDYEPNMNFVGTDSFQYTISDNYGNEATATVSITVYPVDPADADGDRVKGSGKLNSIHVDNSDSDSDSDSDTISFTIDAKRKKDSNEIKGKLKLHDKDLDIKIDAKEITYFGPVQGNCGMIDNGDDGTFIVEVRGIGKFEQGKAKTENAEFKACVVDSDPLDSKGKKTVKGGDFDRFHLECIKDTCAYNTDDRILNDDVIDKGNIQVQMTEGAQSSAAGANASAPQSQGGSSSAATEDDGTASTVFIEPALLSEGVVGQLEVLKINAYDANFRPVVGQAVTLTQTAPDGTQVTLQGITGLTGAALINVVISPVTSSFDATVNGVSSNGVSIKPIGL